MSWLFGRRQARRDQAAGRTLAGKHHAPGFELLVHQLRAHRPRTILDLGPTSTQSLSFLSILAQRVEVCDLFQSAAPRGARSEAFRFDPDRLRLPEGRFDVILVWDLMHYFTVADRPRFGAQLLALAEDDALVLVVASNVAAIPPTPIHFKIVADDRLEYVLASPPTLASPSLHTRQVEQALAGFQPDRHFQLRNGLQELLFRRLTRQVEIPRPAEPARDTSDALRRALRPESH